MPDEYKIKPEPISRTTYGWAAARYTPRNQSVPRCVRCWTNGEEVCDVCRKCVACCACAACGEQTEDQ